MADDGYGGWRTTVEALAVQAVILVLLGLLVLDVWCMYLLFTGRLL